jgi:hypothetical protein
VGAPALPFASAQQLTGLRGSCDASLTITAACQANHTPSHPQAARARGRQTAAAAAVARLAAGAVCWWRAARYLTRVHASTTGGWQAKASRAKAGCGSRLGLTPQCVLRAAVLAMHSCAHTRLTHCTHTAGTPIAGCASLAAVRHATGTATGSGWLLTEAAVRLCASYHHASRVVLPASKPTAPHNIHTPHQLQVSSTLVTCATRWPSLTAMTLHTRAACAVGFARGSSASRPRAHTAARSWPRQRPSRRAGE